MGAAPKPSRDPPPNASEAAGTCEGPAETPASEAAERPSAQAPAAEAPADGAVTLEVVKLDDLRKAIESHKGKVVVLDVWAEY